MWLSKAETDHLDVTSDAPVFALGFDFVEQTDPSTFLVSLFNGGVAVDSFSFSRPINPTSPQFVGVWSSGAFDSMQIRETIGGVEDDLFDEFFTGLTHSWVIRHQPRHRR